ncbi:hypothetical protein TSMEX_003277, partial [Taenia solium]
TALSIGTLVLPEFPLCSISSSPNCPLLLWYNPSSVSLPMLHKFLFQLVAKPSVKLKHQVQLYGRLYS